MGSTELLHQSMIKCDHVNIELEVPSDVPIPIWNVSTVQSWASVLVIMFTSKPHMSAIFQFARHLSWENIQKDW